MQGRDIKYYGPLFIWTTTEYRILGFKRKGEYYVIFSLKRPDFDSDRFKSGRLTYLNAERVEVQE